jgi:hypothetical protein
MEDIVEGQIYELLTNLSRMTPHSFTYRTYRAYASHPAASSAVPATPSLPCRVWHARSVSVCPGAAAGAGTRCSPYCSAAAPGDKSKSKGKGKGKCERKCKGIGEDERKFHHCCYRGKW